MHGCVDHNIPGVISLFLIICPEEEQLLRAGLEEASQQWPEVNCQKGKFVVQ